LGQEEQEAGTGFGTQEGWKIDAWSLNGSQILDDILLVPITGADLPCTNEVSHYRGMKGGNFGVEADKFSHEYTEYRMSIRLLNE
jgi:hypothetical protein